MFNFSQVYQYCDMVPIVRVACQSYSPVLYNVDHIVSTIADSLSKRHEKSATVRVPYDTLTSIRLPPEMTS